MALEIFLTIPYVPIEIQLQNLGDYTWTLGKQLKTNVIIQGTQKCHKLWHA